LEQRKGFDNNSTAGVGMGIKAELDGNAGEDVTLAQCVALLEARRVRICNELADFAQPVAACDADFNALLTERAAIVQALAELLPIARAELRIPHPRDDGPAAGTPFDRRRKVPADRRMALGLEGEVRPHLHPDLFNGFSTKKISNQQGQQ
jgi:hypothetical protein